MLLTKPPLCRVRWSGVSIIHHHSDGTVHAHVGGDELHLHAADGSMLSRGKLGAQIYWLYWYKSTNADAEGLR